MSRVRSVRQSRSFNRRTFLKVASAGAAVHLMPKQPFASAEALPDSVSTFPVGILESSGEPTGPSGVGTLSQRRVIPAEQLPGGDPRVRAQGVRLHFHGIQFPAESRSRNLKLLMLDLETEVGDTQVDSIPWHFWTYSNQGILNVSGEVIAQIPLRNDGSLLFTMTVQSGVDAPRTCQAKLTTGRERGLPKLRSATYYMAVPDGDTRLPPNWETALVLPANSSHAAPVVSAPFPYLMFTLADASSVEATAA